MQISDYESNALNKFCESVQNDKWSNEGIVQLIELAGSFLNLKSIQDYADYVGKSYNGIKKTKKITVLFNNKYIIDND
jgi:hypothetical protein